MPFFEVCKALSEYRRGHFAEAVEWAKKPLKTPQLYAHGHAYAVLAMACWRLGEKDTARAMLDKGNILGTVRHASQYRRGSWKRMGSVALCWRISLDEAAAFIQPGPMNNNLSNKP